MNPRAYQFETDCVNCVDVKALHEAIEQAREVSLSTIRRHVGNLREWEEGMGYQVNKRGGLRLRNDWHVRFARSKYQGRRCYMIVHSAIEYIFTQPRPEIVA